MTALQPPEGCKPKDCGIVDLCARMETGYLPPCARSRHAHAAPIISNSVHCVKEGKCGFKSALAARDGFPCQFVGCVERLPSLPTSKEREATIRNQTLVDFGIALMKEIEAAPNTFKKNPLHVFTEVIKSLRTEADK